MLIIGALAAVILIVLMFSAFGTNQRIKDQSPKIFSSDPYLGNSNAKITLVIFTDFECEFCQAEVQVLKNVLSTYQSTVRLVYKEYPLPSHKNGFRAAEIARCAQDQGKFWQMHDILFNNQEALNKLDLDKISKDAGIDVNKLKTCLEDKSADTKIEQNIAEGQRLGVTEIPTIFVNEKPLTGLNDEVSIESAIEDKLK